MLGTRPTRRDITISSPLHLHRFHPHLLRHRIVGTGDIIMSTPNPRSSSPLHFPTSSAGGETPHAHALRLSGNAREWISVRGLVVVVVPNTT